MAGDWIKMRHSLLSHPKTVRIMSALKADKFRTVGGLMSVWCLFDTHSEDGQLSGYTLETLDAMAAWDGFSAAMQAVEWLGVEDDGTLVLPRFDTHNGQSAKRRAQDSDRKREVRKVSASEADKLRTREEKRRYRERHPHTPTAFDRFWAAYPKRVSKGAARKAWTKLKPSEQLLQAILAGIGRAKTSAQWLRDDGRFVPHPAT